MVDEASGMYRNDVAKSKNLGNLYLVMNTTFKIILVLTPVLLYASNEYTFASQKRSHTTSRYHRRSFGHPTSRGSFLKIMVYTAPDLIYQLEEHPAIAARYARHYHTSSSNIIRYMKSNLVESYMPRTQVFTTYWVRENGQIRTGRERITKGTRVFALRNGQPVLKWACGNPLTSSLPPIRMITDTYQQEFRTKISPSEQVLIPSEPADVVVPNETPPALVAKIPDEPIRFSAAAIPPAAAQRATFPWIFLAAIPIAIGVTHTGGGGSTTPAPTPENKTIISLVLAAGFGTFLATRRRRQESP